MWWFKKRKGVKHCRKCTQETNDKFNLDDSVEDLLDLIYSPGLIDSLSIQSVGVGNNQECTLTIQLNLTLITIQLASYNFVLSLLKNGASEICQKIVVELLQKLLM